MGIQVFFDGLRNILALLIAEFLLVYSSMQKKKNFYTKLMISILSCCVLSAVYAILYVSLTEFFGLISIISIVWYFSIYVFTGYIIYLCFNIRATELLWSMITAYAIQHIVYVIAYELCAPLLSGFWTTLLVYVLICAVFYTFFYWTFRKNIKNLFEFYLGDKIKNILSFGILLVIFMTSTYINQLIFMVSNVYVPVLAALSDLIICAFVLTLQFIVLRMSHIDREKQISEKLLEAKKKQYETFASSVEYVNIKCHDLKHSINRIWRAEEFNSKKIEEIINQISIYDAFAKTGNENLDIVLTEKNLLCLSENIALTYMAEADGLSALDAEEIYSLFGNLLDNAIEYERTVEDVKKRFIRLFIRPQGNLLLIHMENYFEGNLEFKNGVPQTTKGDNTLHGFGVRSMQLTVKKNQGSMRMSIEDGLFKTEICLRVK